MYCHSTRKHKKTRSTARCDFNHSPTTRCLYLYSIGFSFIPPMTTRCPHPYSIGVSTDPSKINLRLARPLLGRGLDCQAYNGRNPRRDPRRHVPLLVHDSDDKKGEHVSIRLVSTTGRIKKLHNVRKDNRWTLGSLFPVRPQPADFLFSIRLRVLSTCIVCTGRKEKDDSRSLFFFFLLFLF